MQYNPLLDRDARVPHFERIQPAHFMPALEFYLKQARLKIEALCADETAVDFDTLAIPLHDAFTDTWHVTGIFEHFTVAKRCEGIAALQTPFQTLYDKFSKSVFQNPVLAARFKTLYAGGAHGQTGEKAHLLTHLNRKFLREGAYLNENEKQRLRAIDEKLIALASQFSDNLITAQLHHAVWVQDESILAGLDDNTKASLRRAAQAQGKEGWLIPIERLLIDTLMDTARNRDLCKQLLQAVDAVGTQEPCDNRPLLPQFAALRDERAKLLGFAHFAAFALDGTMPGDLPAVEAMLDQMARPVLDLYAQDLSLIQTYARENGGPDVLEPHDAGYWAQQYKKAFFAFDEREMSEYLAVDTVLEGYLNHTQRLFKITFIENDLYPRVHPDVRMFDVTDTVTGELRGIFCVDAYARDNKRGGAWMNQPQRADRTHVPVVCLNLNQLKPEPGTQTLMTPEEVITLFHEGGHSTHGLMGSQGHFAMLQGTEAGTPEFIEIPSTMQERWALNYDTLSRFAKHHATGEKIPARLLEAFKRAESFYKPFERLRMIQNTLYDLTFHKQGADFVSAQDTQAKARLDHPLAMYGRPYPLTRFGHLFEEGLSQYAAGYFGYLWSDIYSAHAFKKFEEAGDPYDPQISNNVVQLYSAGCSLPSAQIYAALSPEPVTPDALLKEMGYKPPVQAAPKPVMNI